jgi:hypothetical protein
LPAALLLGHCAPLEWQRADTSPYETQNDLERCWSAADREAREATFAPMAHPALGFVANGRGGQVAAPMMQQPPAGGLEPPELQLRRSQAVERCMRAKGYAATQW